MKPNQLIQWKPWVIKKKSVTLRRVYFNRPLDFKKNAVKKVEEEVKDQKPIDSNHMNTTLGQYRAPKAGRF